MKRLNMSITIDPAFTAEDWQLYTSSMDCVPAANSLNKALKEAVNSGANREDVEKLVNKEMNRLRNFGAIDSEPRWFLEDVLDQIFGKAGLENDWK